LAVVGGSSALAKLADESSAKTLHSDPANERRFIRNLQVLLGTE